MHNAGATLGMMLGGWEVIFIMGIMLLMAAGVVLIILTVLTILKGFQRRSENSQVTRAESANARSMSKTAVSTATCPRCGSPLPANALQGLCPRCVLGVGIETQGATAQAFRDEQGKPNPPDSAILSKHFPQLEIIELLGLGGMGAVYKARQKDLDRVVALKILPGGENGDPAFAERFSREARALARLSHPCIVAVHDFGQVDGFYYFIMEHIDGPNLRQLMQHHKLSPREAMTIVPRICEALQYAHDEGIVHRDIKPENILLDQKGAVKIADFGIAKIVGKRGDAALTGAKDVIGTPHYMAPEQVEHPTSVDHRADIYSLGVVFYEMLTGELPLGKFEVPSRRVQVDVRLDDVVLHSLEKEPARRYQHASEVKTDVETISTGEEAPGLSKTRPTASEVHEVVKSMGLIVAQWTARILGTMLLVFYAIFIVAEGLPPFATQSVGVQLNFVALGLMLGGFAVGWRREGTAALLIASGWTLWHISEGRIDLNLFQTPLPVAALYAYCWWELRGRRTGVLLGTIAALAVALGLGRLFLPVNVFVQGSITDATTGAVITNASLTIAQKRPIDRDSNEPPNAHTDMDGRFRLHLGWYTARQQVEVVAPGYVTLTTNLGPRELGQRRMDRNFKLGAVESLQTTANGVPTFGPVSQALLASPQGRIAELLDLDTGQRATNTVFGVNDRETHAWIRSQNVDVMGVVEKGQIAVLCFDMAVIPVESNQWETATPQQVLTNWNLTQQEPKPVVGVSPVTEHTDTYIFQTRDGGSGIFKIVGQNDQPPGVNIEYRLIHPIEPRR